MAAADRIAYFNGRFVPEREVLVPFRDRGFKYGDAVFDTTRTFGHRVFKLAEHVERLYRSLRYLRIDPGVHARGDGPDHRGSAAAQPGVAGAGR